MNDPVTQRTVDGIVGIRRAVRISQASLKAVDALYIIIIIINFYSPVSNTRCHSIGHKMRIARIKIRVDSPGRWERA